MRLEIKGNIYEIYLCLQPCHVPSVLIFVLVIYSARDMMSTLWTHSRFKAFFEVEVVDW
jgi:hypothetical protein